MERSNEWRAVAALMRRPQPVTLPIVALFALIPFYLVIGHGYVAYQPLHAPALPLDDLVPVMPAWSGVYGSLFVAAFLPVFVLHQQELIRRTVLAYLAVWLVSYAAFLWFPTIGPRATAVAGNGFAAWGLRLIYSSDLPYNCFPSLHVAQCCLAAGAAWRVHRGVGAGALVWALLVGVSTVLTKQHYVLDVFGGIALAGLAYLAALHGYPRAAVPAVERQLAPRLALLAFALYGLIVAGLWVLWATGLNIGT